MSDETFRREDLLQAPNSGGQSSERKAKDPRPEIDELTRTLSRLLQAGIATSTDVVSKLIQIQGNVLSDAAAAISKPLQSATGKKDKGDRGPIDVDRVSDGFVDMTESVDRSIKEVADLIDQSVKRFTDEYSKR